MAHSFKILRILFFILVICTSLFILLTLGLKLFNPLFVALLRIKGWPEFINFIGKSIILICIIYVGTILAIYIARFLLRTGNNSKKMVLGITLLIGVYSGILLWKHPEYKINPYALVREVVISESLKFSEPGQTLNSVKLIPFTHGVALQFNKLIVFGPEPTNDEFTKFILSSPNHSITAPIKNIVSIVKNSDEFKTSFDAVDEKIMQEQGIESYYFPVDIDSANALDVFNIAVKIKSLPGPTFVYNSSSPKISAAMQLLVLSYLTEAPALNEALFQTHPAIEVITPNIAIGPTPKNDGDFYYLKKKGISYFTYIGNCNKFSSLIILDTARISGLKAGCFDSLKPFNPALFLNHGPRYLCGKEMPTIKNQLIAAYQKKMPIIVRKFYNVLHSSIKN